jgi:hypothetical protein
MNLIPEMLKKRCAEDPLCTKFTAWMDNALQGDKFCYYTGKYVAGKLVARLVFKLYEKKVLVLFQKKSDDGMYEYWAQRR